MDALEVVKTYQADIEEAQRKLMQANAAITWACGDPIKLKYVDFDRAYHAANQAASIIRVIKVRLAEADTVVLDS